MMSDVEARVEGRTSMQFLNKKCHIQNGPIKLAVATKAIIAPVINYKDATGNNVIKIEEPILPDKMDTETTNQTIDRVTINYFRNVEKWIKNYPDQVHLWPDICSTLTRDKDDKIKHQFEY